MSLERGRFGIEYKPRPRRKDSSAVGPVVVVVLALAAISFAWTKLRRADEEAFPADAPPIQQPAPAPAELPPRQVRQTQPPQQSQTAAPPSYLAVKAHERAPKVKNLLLRLEEAEKMGNVEMAVTTIEALRSLPGEPAADLDDRLARRLGELNTRWLFELANRQWVADVTVRPRDTATRIAAAHGSTLSSLIRLNALKDADDIRSGQTLRVMNHPRFSLTVHRRARFADLHLNGRFFNRYDIKGTAEICPVGVYKTTDELRSQLLSLGLRFSLRDRIELETLIPQNATIVVSET